MRAVGRSISLRLVPALAAAAAFAACMSCDCGDVVGEMADTDPFGWSMPVETTFENRDTAALRDVAIVLRYGSDIDTDNLSLTLAFTAPDSSRFVDRVRLPLGKVRKAASAAALETIPYRRDVIFRQQGTYRVEIMPAGRVKGIEAAGIAIGAAQQNR